MPTKKKTDAAPETTTKTARTTRTPTAPRQARARVTKHDTSDDDVVAVAAHHPTHADVAVRAYHRFLARGGQHGHDVCDWLAAELELRLALPV